MKISLFCRFRRVLPLAVAGLSMWLVVFLLASPAFAAGLHDLDRGEQGLVQQVFDGDTILLDTGLRVRLVGLNAPEIAYENRPAEPFGLESRAMLEKLLKGQSVTLYYGGTRRDRYGRALAQIERADGLWIQQAMLEQGGARVYSFADNRALVPPMLAAERTAREKHLGLWALPLYAVRDADQPITPLHFFHIVEGRVQQVKPYRQQVFINFGDNWKKDFTAVVPGDAQKTFDPAMLQGLEGKKIRVRGWVDYMNGPSLILNHPEQIEIVP